ncbi:hypothetical protein VUR80DRAFT_9040 [Thermomyces stellatus]
MLGCEEPNGRSPVVFLHYSVLTCVEQKDSRMRKEKTSDKLQPRSQGANCQFAFRIHFQIQIQRLCNLKRWRSWGKVRGCADIRWFCAQPSAHLPRTFRADTFQTPRSLHGESPSTAGTGLLLQQISLESRSLLSAVADSTLVCCARLVGRVRRPVTTPLVR